MKLELAADEAAVLTEHLTKFRHTVKSIVKQAIAEDKPEHEVREILRQHQHDLKAAIAGHMGHERAKTIFDELQDHAKVAEAMAEIDRRYPD